MHMLHTTAAVRLHGSGRPCPSTRPLGFRTARRGHPGRHANAGFRKSWQRPSGQWPCSKLAEEP
eukprot:6780258-Lingulodinium_polyedra.AAC.1